MRTAAVQQKSNSIKEWPHYERPCERLSRFGASALSDSELLAILIHLGDFRQRKSAIDLARDLLSQAGDLAKLRRYTLGELQQHQGIGLIKACRLHAAFDLHRRMQHIPQRRERAQTTAEQASLLRLTIGSPPQERFAALFVDHKMDLIRAHELARGSVNRVHLFPRELFRLAISEQAAAIVVGHNHPSGDPAPSDADRKLTVAITCLGEMLDIPLLDHIILGSEDRLFSFAAIGGREESTSLP